MKKLFIILSLILCLVLVACNESTSSTETSATSETSLTSGAPTSTQGDSYENDGASGNETNEIFGTPIEVEYDAEREAKDNEFPFDNIILERKGYNLNGYDFVAAGRYYGNDFNNIKYYGSYYRIIDNYDDFSTLTQWGKEIDESIFEENVILVLHTYKSYYFYNSVRVDKGNFVGLQIEEDTNELSIFEQWTTHDRAEIEYVDGVQVPVDNTSTEVLIPADVQETIYLIIPKDELTANLPTNGEINLKYSILVME